MMAVNRDQPHDRSGHEARAVSVVSGAPGDAPPGRPGTVAEFFSTAPRSLRRLATGCLGAALRRYRRRRTTAVLRSLDDRTLKAIGVSRCALMALARGVDPGLRRHRYADD